MTWISSADDAGHYAVIITAVDGSSPHQPWLHGWLEVGRRFAFSRLHEVGAVAGLNGNKLDIKKLDDAELIFEVDNALPEAEISVTPARVDERLETESRYPFIHIEFNGLTDDDDNDIGEDAEYKT